GRGAAARTPERLGARPRGARARQAALGVGRLAVPAVPPREPLVAEAELLQRPPAEVLDEDVGLRGEPAHEGEPVRLLQVDGDAALVAVVDEVPGGLAVLVRRPRA